MGRAKGAVLVCVMFTDYHILVPRVDPGLVGKGGGTPPPVHLNLKNSTKRSLSCFMHRCCGALDLCRFDTTGPLTIRVHVGYRLQDSRSLVHEIKRCVSSRFWRLVPFKWRTQVCGQSLFAFGVYAPTILLASGSPLDNPAPDRRETKKQNKTNRNAQSTHQPFASALRSVTKHFDAAVWTTPLLEVAATFGPPPTYLAFRPRYGLQELEVGGSGEEVGGGRPRTVVAGGVSVAPAQPVPCVTPGRTGGQTRDKDGGGTP